MKFTTSVCVLALAAHNVQGFVPLSPESLASSSSLSPTTSSSTGTTTQFVGTSTSQPLIHYGSSHPPRVSSPSRRSAANGSSLSMMATGGGGGNFLDRFVRVVNSNINKFISGVENPEKLILQATSDMQSDLIKIRQAYSEATASRRRLERQREQVDSVANDWYQRAQLALRNDNEGLAREALARRQQLVEQVSSLQAQINTQRIATDKLYEAMTTLESKIQEAVAKKDQLIARAKTAKSMQQINDMLSGLTGNTSMDAFNRMEQKVESLEAAAEVSAEKGLLKFNDSVESQFRMLEQSSEVDFELERMKSEINNNRSPMLGASREGGSIPVRPARDRVSGSARGRGESNYIR